MLRDVPTWGEVVGTDLPEMVDDHLAYMEKVPVEVAGEMDRAAERISRALSEMMPSY